MKFAMTFRRLLVWTGLAFLAASGSALAQEEAISFNGFAVVQGSGAAARTGEKSAMMVARFEGPFFVESDDGPIQAGRVACLGSAKADLDSTRLTASGSCTFNAADGATAWGEWECSGLNLVGCRGTFKLAGGTGRFAGVSGESKLIWRPTASEFKRLLQGAATTQTSGVISWRDFKVKEKPAPSK